MRRPESNGCKPSRENKGGRPDSEALAGAELFPDFPQLATELGKILIHALFETLKF
jgi:hypothetical protein